MWHEDRERPSLTAGLKDADIVTRRTLGGRAAVALRGVAAAPPSDRRMRRP
jgi:hypothetical protein